MMRLYDWEVGKHQILVEDTVHTFRQYLPASHWEDYEEQQENMLTSWVLRNKFWNEVQWITDQDKGGIYHPRDI